jgi:hypothetical protein
VGTGFLTTAQIAKIKAARARAWNRDFVVETTVVQQQTTDYYDTPALLASGTTRTLQGDWAWKGQQQFRGGPGGVIDDADLMLATDILNSGALVATGVHLKVDGITVAVKRATPYPDSGEIVISAVRVV